MITIRRFTPGDEQHVQDLIVTIMNSEFKTESAAYPVDDIRNIPTAYGKIGEGFFVAEDNSRIIGTVAVKKEDDRVALMRRLFVAPQYRNQKIGAKLIDRALHFCQEMGYDEVVFKATSNMSKAVEICKKKGFVARAKLQLGSVELCKLVISLRNGHAAKSAK